ncbi:hypothetical protein LGG40_002910 [Salmonella enterica]|nr:hypothetical protein [Salmonella enterica]EBS5589697.1 hypothetical protein [Salmonella enterica subsp. enterica serovar Newport]ECJ8827948.1 hypothetical protein [Salmonella enterica subsp. enterica serovar Oranienburg]EEJ2339985.1 hypothetical protein [Salmonella enterica subsp. enterica serovar Oslo]MJL35562.1 hypothetical protein [Salmonella enterica subsp. enterica serovar Minnesota]
MEIKQPTEDELREFLLCKYLEAQSNQELYEVNKETRKSVAKYKDRLMNVTPELFFRFLSEKGVSGMCISCGSSRLSVPESSIVRWAEGRPKNFKDFTQEEQIELVKNNTQRYVSYTSFDDANKPSGIRKSYYMVHCLNCGYLSLYRSSAVLSWLEKDNVQGGDNE